MMDETRLRDQHWEVRYSHEDGDLVELFYRRVLSKATLYQRATGYFSGDVLALAGRGVDKLIERGGRMELLVGCTLSDEDVQQITAGYDVREAVAKSMVNRIALSQESLNAREILGRLAWMIAHGHLDVKVAIPLDDRGKMRAGLGLYHEKVGIVSDSGGDRIVFTGSINETPAGWLHNVESFDVNFSWGGVNDELRVKRCANQFERLWSGRSRAARVMDVPEAVKLELLKFLPTNDTVVRPPHLPADPSAEEMLEIHAPELSEPDMDELRSKIWTAIREAPSRPDGEMVAVVTSAITPWPHQLRAYKRILDAWPARLLIADEVGLGKTIEAGLVIRHCWISGMAKRILILAPSAVVTQWQNELYEKFNLRVPRYENGKLILPACHGDEAPLEREVARTKWAHERLVLASSHLVRRSDRRNEVLDAPNWDLIVLDEAHHARRSSPGTPQEGGPNRLLTLMRQLQAKTNSLLLLTATPMQVHPVELWDLLSLLGLPEVWNPQTFLNYFEGLATNPNEKALHRLAKLFQATEAAFGPTQEAEIQEAARRGAVDGKIKAGQVVKALREPISTMQLRRLDVAQRKMALELLRAASPVARRMLRNTRALLRRYHKAGLLTENVAERDPIDIPVRLSTAERSIYDAVEDYIADTWEKAAKEDRNAVGFVMTIYRRRVASSFYALKRTLQNRFDRLSHQEQLRTEKSMSTEQQTALIEDLPQDETATEQVDVAEALTLEQTALSYEERAEIQGLLKDIAKLGTDSKALRCCEELEKAFAAGYDSAIVFTQFTDTMDYLRDFLATRIHIPMGCYSGRGGERRDSSGKWVICSKDRIKQDLRTGSVKLLICTDAAGEGLNLQTCGVLVNYDLPWNPMKVEQRIGRIDRIGQRYPRVLVINLAYQDTVEADVYFALSQRINLFEGVVGKLQPILAKVPREFEATMICKREEREAKRATAVHSIATMVEKAKEADFDIDAVSDSDITVPKLPNSPFTPAHMEVILRSKRLMPRAVECETLDKGTFKVRIPGSPQWLRVTPLPTVFDEHTESHQLLLPDGLLFNELVELVPSAIPGEATVESLLQTLPVLNTPIGA